MLISPAKTLDFSQSDYKEHTLPVFLKESKQLISILKKKSVPEIKTLMKVSDKIAILNVERYHNFKTPFSSQNAKQAILAFQGDVYRGLNAADFNKKDFEFSQKHLRILSGLYGVLKPLDLMQAYRLEMGTRLEHKAGSNLYQFWGDKITEQLNADLTAQKDDIILNLASKEYFKSVNPKRLNGRLIEVNFKEEKDDKFKIVAFFAKKARGMMCHYVIKNKIKKLNDLKGFDYENYCYNEALSTADSYIFTR